jgi:hypothetical protein
MPIKDGSPDQGVSKLVFDEGKRLKDDGRAIRCASCDWQEARGTYHKTFQGKQLRGLNFEPELDAYLTNFPRARTGREKMLAIDMLIHAVHTGTAKPAATNLLAGKAGELTLFLDRLAYGEGSTPGVEGRKAAWDSRLHSSSHWSKFLDDSREN